MNTESSSTVPPFICAEELLVGVFRWDWKVPKAGRYAAELVLGLPAAVPTPPPSASYIIHIEWTDSACHILKPDLKLGYSLGTI